ncbi:MAG: chitobiase/beta-hexosaminidase C-terminal domain-containing protein, partial [Verrucomicrobium sp.]
WEAGEAVVNLRGQVHCISTLQSPAVKWSSVAKDHAYNPVLAWGKVYTVSNGTTPTVRVYDRNSGTLLQTLPLPAQATSQPVVTQDCLIVSSGNTTQLIRVEDGTVQQTLPKGGLLTVADNTLVITNPTARTVDAFGAPPLIHFHPGSTASTTSIDVKTGVTIPEAVIYYTTDGSTPTDQSPTLTNLSSMRFLRTTTLKSIGIHSGFKGPVTTEVFTITDANTNGLPDWWEQQYGGQRAVPVTTLDPALDDDGDFLSNLQEFVAGTNPNSADTLMTPSQTSDGAGITLSWPGQLGRFYSVLTSQDLKVWETVTDATQKPGTGGTMTWTDANGVAAGRKFYRIVISVP